MADELLDECISVQTLECSARSKCTVGMFDARSYLQCRVLLSTFSSLPSLVGFLFLLLDTPPPELGLTTRLTPPPCPSGGRVKTILPHSWPARECLSPKHRLTLPLRHWGGWVFESGWCVEVLPPPLPERCTRGQSRIFEGFSADFGWVGVGVGGWLTPGSVFEKSGWVGEGH